MEEIFEQRNKIRDFLSKNNNHTLSIFVILFLSVILFYRSFLEDGQILYVDMMFPNSLGRNFEFFCNTWYPYGSFSLVPITLLRLPWMSLSLIPAIALNINFDDYLLFLFIFTFFFAGLNSYILTYYSIDKYRSYTKNNENIKYDVNDDRFLISLASCVTSLIYMYNPLSLGLFWAYGFYPTYALLPMIILLIFVAFDKNSIPYLFITAFFMMLASTSIHSMVWILICFMYSSIYLTLEKFELKRFFINLKIIAKVLLLYLILMSFWILPTIIIITNGGSTQPDYNVTKTLTSLSGTSSMDKSLRILSGTRFLISPEYIGKNPINISVSDLNRPISNSSAVHDPYWNFFSYFIPILGFGSFLLYKDSPLMKKIYFFIIISMISIFLSLGTNSPLPYPYIWFSLDAPGSNFFGWIFRAPYRFLIFAALGFSILCGYSIFKILDIGKEYKKNNYLINLLCIALVIFFLIGIIYFILPVAMAHANYIFNPTKIPREYDDINKWLAAQDGDFKVLWLPKYPESGYFPSWAGPFKRIGPVNIASSNRESYSTFYNSQAKKYLNQLDTLIRTNPSLDLGKTLSPLGIKYIILDNSMKNSIDLKERLDSSNIKPVYNAGFIYIYENTNFVYQRINILNETIDVNNKRSYTLLPQIQYEKIGYNKYKMNINSSNSFMLSFAEAYDPLWEAKVYKNGKNIINVNSIPLYSIINGFEIDEIGNLEIIIRYKPQYWFEIGLFISIFTFFTGTAAVIFMLKRRHSLNISTGKV